jgi:hypothetical protein
MCNLTYRRSLKVAALTLTLAQTAAHCFRSIPGRACPLQHHFFSFICLFSASTLATHQLIQLLCFGFSYVDLADCFFSD